MESSGRAGRIDVAASPCECPVVHRFEWSCWSNSEQGFVGKLPRVGFRRSPAFTKPATPDEASTVLAATPRFSQVLDSKP